VYVLSFQIFTHDLVCASSAKFGQPAYAIPPEKVQFRQQDGQISKSWLGRKGLAANKIDKIQPKFTWSFVEGLRKLAIADKLNFRIIVSPVLQSVSGREDQKL